MHVQQVQDDANVVHLIQRRRRRRAPRRESLGKAMVGRRQEVAVWSLASAYV